MSDVLEAIRKIEQTERNKLASLSNKSQFEIQETIYLGKMKNGKELYRLAELDTKDNYSSVIYKYFNENAELQGVKNVRPDGEEEWVYLEEEWEQIKDEIDKNEAQLEEEIEEILSKLGIEKEDIENITELDLEQEVEEEEKEQEEDEQEEDKNEEPKEEEEEKVESQQTSVYKNVLNEIDTNKDVDQRGTDLGEALGLEQYGYTKLLIVHADNVRDIKDADGKRQDNSTKKLAVLGVRVNEKGQKVIEKIPEDVLDYYRGSNNESVRFGDNDQVEKNSGTYERFVNPKTNRGIGIEMSEMETKVYYQGGIDRDDNTAVMGRVEDSHTGWVEADTKRVFNSNHGIYHQDKVNEEMEQHKEDNRTDRENADGDLYTTSEHIHKIETPDDEIVYDGEVLKASEVADKLNIPLVMFMQEYNKRAKELEGEEEINLEEDLYDEIKDRSEERIEEEPEREEGGWTPGENEDPRRG